LQIKGVAEPVTAYRVERALSRPEKVRGIDGLKADLIGRDEEFAKLKDALSGVLRGRGEIVSLIGEAGVGKSRLLSELKQVALHEDGEDPTPLWLEGRCLELGLTASYWPFIDLLRHGFGLRSEDDEPTRADRLTSALRRLVEEGHLPEARFEEIGPLLGRLLSIRFGNAWDERLRHADGEQIKHRTFTAVRDLFLALAKRQPVILVFEDLHWADPLSIDLISLLMDSLTLAPLLLLCVYRPEQEHKCWRLGTIASRKCPERYTELQLHELTPRQSRRLIESLLEIDQLPEATKELLLEKSGGNPFFVEEVIRSLIDAGMVYREGDAWKAKEGIDSVKVPESIQSVILSRMDRLEAALKHVLQSAAVIGRLFRRRLLERIAQGETDMERALWELEDHAFIYQERAVPEEEYSFQHVLTQEAVYHNILKRRQRVFHRRVAEALEALYQGGLEEHYEQLAYHYDRSGEVEKAIEYLLKAGEKARQTYLNEEATGYFQRALERLEEPGRGEAHKGWRLEALTGLGKIAHGLGQESEAEAHLRRAVAVAAELGVTPRERVRLYHWLGDALFWQGRYDEVIRLGEEGLQLLGDDQECVEAALMNSRLLVAHSQKGDQARAREYGRRNERFLARLPYSEELVSAYRNVAQHYGGFELDTERALEWLKLYGQKAKAHQDLRGMADARRQTGEMLASRGDLQGAIAHYVPSLELFAKIGDVRYGGLCSRGLAEIYLTLGDFQKAEVHLQRALEAAEEGGVASIAAGAHHGLGTVALCRGDAEEAVAAFRKAVQLYREIGNQAEGFSLYALGQAYRRCGQPEEARTAFEEAARQAVSLGGLSSSSITLAAALSELEGSHEDPEAFRAFCRDLRRQHPEVGGRLLTRWFLAPAQPQDFPRESVHERFQGSLSSEWTWEDPFQDCAHEAGNGLVIRAGHGRHLSAVNHSAPRLTRRVSGDFAAEAVCAPASPEALTIGGLLLWKDRESFLILYYGLFGRGDVSFWIVRKGSLAFLVGRGLGPAERVHLRLERRGDQVTALCSEDGSRWHAVGSTPFPASAEAPVEISLFAAGLNTGLRAIHPGEHEDTAIRFESFTLWGAG
jgi:predicted ATPase/regulation of enolase protein 1 (concanavalin A-like superfamily)